MVVELNLSKSVDLDAQSVVTGRGCVIGQSGSGKSYLVGVIVEELCRNRLPFLIIDTEGEYRSLKSMFNILWVGKDRSADVGIDTQYRKLFQKCVESGMPVIFDVSEVADKQDYVYRALDALYQVEEQKRKPFLAIIEEADKFAPQIVKPRMSIIEEISVRGRKRGLGLLIATQRPASVSKNVLAQCSYGFIGKLTIENDLQAISQLINDRKLLNGLVQFETGTFLPFGMKHDRPFRVKPRVVVPGGATPVLAERLSEGPSVSDIVRGLKAVPEIVTEALSEPTGKSAPKMAASVIAARFSADDAAAKAQGLLKKKFGLFGDAVESVDSIKPRYIQLAACDIRVPTRKKNEFREHSLLVMGNRLVTFGKGIEFNALGIEKPARLTPADLAVLGAIARRGRADLPQIEDDLGESNLSRAVSKLQRSGHIREDKGRYSIPDYSRHTQKLEGEQTQMQVPESSVVNYDRNCLKNAELLSANIFPGSRPIRISETYLPIYEITLRHGSRVRVFIFDALYLKDITGLLKDE